MDNLRENHKEFTKISKLIFKPQERVRSKKLNVFPEEVDKIALSASDGKRVQSVSSIKTCACGKSKDLANEKEGIQCNNIVKQCKT